MDPNTRGALPLGISRMPILECFDNAQPGTDGALRIVFMRLWVTEIRHQSIAQIMRDIPLKLVDNLRARGVGCLHKRMQLFRIEMIGEALLIEDTIAKVIDHCDYPTTGTASTSVLLPSQGAARTCHGWLEHWPPAFHNRSSRGFRPREPPEALHYPIRRDLSRPRGAAPALASVRAGGGGCATREPAGGARGLQGCTPAVPAHKVLLHFLSAWNLMPAAG
jgi:hypothetical protein